MRVTRKVLASIEASLIESHIRWCVQKSFRGKSEEDKDEKIEEVIRLFKSSVTQGVDL